MSARSVMTQKHETHETKPIFFVSFVPIAFAAFVVIARIRVCVVSAQWTRKKDDVP